MTSLHWPSKKAAAGWRRPIHPVSTQFFELFGFQAVVMARGNAGNNVHMFLMADVYQNLKPRIFEFLQHMDTRYEVVTSDAPKDACASCGLGPQALVAGNGVGGYKCSLCGFIRIYGPNLTLGPAEASTTEAFLVAQVLIKITNGRGDRI
jgi:hypothetical protein